MRKTTSLALLMLGGCASAGAPQPAAVEPAPVAVNIRPVQADSGKAGHETIAMARGACETNDPMPTGNLRVTPQKHPGLMPGMRMHLPVAPMPNLCPVTVPATRQLFYHAVPAGVVQLRVPKSVPVAKP